MDTRMDTRSFAELFDDWFGNWVDGDRECLKTDFKDHMLDLWDDAVKQFRLQRTEHILTVRSSLSRNEIYQRSVRHLLYALPSQFIVEPAAVAAGQ